MNKSLNGSMFWRLWWRAISVKRSQAALALGALVVGAAITSMLLNLYGDVRRKMTEDIRSYGANVVVAPALAKSSGGGASSEVMEESAVEPLVQFARRAPGMSFVPVLYGVVHVSPRPADQTSAEFVNAVAAGAEFGALRRLNPGWREAGEAVSADLPPGECAVGSNLAARLHLRPGDSIDLRRVTGSGTDEASSFTAFRIATVLTSGGSEDDQVFVPLATLQSILRMAGKVTLVEASIPGETRDVESAVGRLARLVPGLEVRPIRQIVYSEGRVLVTIRWLLLSLTALILVIIALCVMATMTAIVLERRKDIGVMKALGAADALLMRLFVAEGAGLGLVGGGLGCAVGLLLARDLAERLFGVALNWHAWTLPVVCGLTVALAVVAAQLPVRIVRAIQPTVVLKGE
jgi:putative ABC transport system permease protein